MYLPFYKLAEKPFNISTNPRFLWRGEKHQEALANLKYGLLEANGYVVLTGDVGTGKTTLVNALVETLDDNVLVANINHPTLDTVEFFNLVAKTYDASADIVSKTEFLFFFNSFLQKTHASGKVVLLVIDEAHRLSKELLEEIRLLSNIEQSGNKLINIFFVGQDELKEVLLSPHCRALRQRITLFYDIEPLSKDETNNYVVHRLKVAGAKTEIFQLEAIKEIHKFSRGYPRLINIICDRALLTGYVKEQRKIDASIVSECAMEISFLDPKASKIKISQIDRFSSWGRPLVEKLRSQTAAIKDKHPLDGEHFKKKLGPKANKLKESAHSIINQLLKKNRRALIPIGLGVVIALIVAAVGIGMHTGSAIQKEAPLKLEETATEKGAKDRILITENGSIQQKPLAPPQSTPKEMEPVLTKPAPNVPRPETKIQQSFSTEVTEKANILTVSDPETSAPKSPRPETQRLQSDSTEVTEKADTLTVSDPEASAPKSPRPEPHRQQPDSNEVTEKADTLTESGQLASAMPSNEEILVEESESLRENPSDELQSNNPPVVEISSSPQPTTIELATNALEQKKYQTAIDLIEADRNRTSNSSLEAREIYSNALVGRADQVVTSSPYEAETMLRKAIETNPKNVQAYHKLGKIYTRSKDYALAIDAYQTAVTLNPKLSDAFFNLGFIYATSGMYEDAEKLFARAVQLEPPYIDKALFNLAVIQEKLGKKEECMANLQMAIMIRPENEKAQTFLDQLLKAEEKTQ